MRIDRLSAAHRSVAAREVARVRAHIRDAVARCRLRRIPALSPSATLARELLLDEFEAYADAGRFPRHHEAHALTPLFVDARGVHCVVAHAMLATGDVDLVDRIALRRNRQRAADLVVERGVAAWLGRVGFVPADLACLQPAYGVTPLDDPGPVASPTLGVASRSADSVLDATVVDVASDGTLEARIDVVHGLADVFSVGESVPVSRPFAARAAIGQRLVVAATAVRRGSDWDFAFDGLLLRGRPEGRVSAIRLREEDDDVVLASFVPAGVASIDSRAEHDLGLSPKVLSGMRAVSAHASTGALLRLVPGLVALDVKRTFAAGALADRDLACGRGCQGGASGAES